MGQRSVTQLTIGMSLLLIQRLTLTWWPNVISPMLQHFFLRDLYRDSLNKIESKFHHTWNSITQSKQHFIFLNWCTTFITYVNEGTQIVKTRSGYSQKDECLTNSTQSNNFLKKNGNIFKDGAIHKPIYHFTSHAYKK